MDDDHDTVTWVQLEGLGRVVRPPVARGRCHDHDDTWTPSDDDDFISESVTTKCDNVTVTVDYEEKGNDDEFLLF